MSLPDPEHLIHSTASGEWVDGGIVGRYRLEDCLGRGGAGEVWRVTHLPTGAQRALKTLLPFAELQDRERFVREGQALATLDGHPHVVRVHEVGELAGRAYLVMDLARSEDLNARLKAGPLPAEEARQLLIDLASGLAHVHRHGLLHRDLKPHNVLFADDGRPLLSDFGLVRGPSRSSLSVTGEILGTPAYMAPEQALGEPVDERTDVYGLGAVLYHVLCGHPPFQGRTPITVLTQVIQESPRPPSSHVPDVPPDLERVCLRALAKDPNQRFPSARALGNALTTPAAQPLRWARPLLAVSVLGAGLAAGALLRTLNAEAPPPPPTTDPLATSAVVDAEPESAPESQVDLDAFLADLDFDAAWASLDPDLLLEHKRALAFAPVEGKSLGHPESFPTLLRRLEEAKVPRLALCAIHYRHALESETPVAGEDPVTVEEFARAKANGWFAFALFVRDSDHEVLDLPAGACLELSWAILERGAERGSWRCARSLGDAYERGAPGLDPDPERAFCFQCLGTPYVDPVTTGSEEEKETHKRQQEKQQGHVVHLYDLWRSLDRTPPEADPYQVLRVVEIAIYNERFILDPEAQEFLTTQRHALQRQVGSATIAELREALDTPEARQRVEASSTYSDYMKIGERPDALFNAGQQFCKDGKTEASGESPAQRRARRRRDFGTAFVALTMAIEEGKKAWCDLGSTTYGLDSLSITERVATIVETGWRGAEQGDLRAIASLGDRYRNDCRRWSSELVHLREVMEHMEALTFRDLTEDYQKLKLATAAAFLILEDPSFDRWSRDEVADHLQEAIELTVNLPPPDRDPWGLADRERSATSTLSDARALLKRLRPD